MTLPVEVAKVRLTYPGDTTPLALSGGSGALYFLSPGHLVVTLTPTGGADQPLHLGEHFTISGDGTVGAASLVPSSAMAAGVITVRRETPATQQFQWVDGDGNPSGRFGSAEDYDRLIDQELKEKLSRAIVAPESEAAGNWVLPSVQDRASKLMAFGPDGAINLELPDAAGMLAAAEAAAETLAEVEAAIAALGSAAVDLYRPTDGYLNAPAGTEPDGYRALVGKAPSGAFAGKMGLVAQKNAGVWLFSGTPKAGQRLFDKASGLFWVQQNGWWNKLKPGMSGYQDFADVPDGTHVSGLVIATGQTINAQGPGAATGTVANGRYEPPSNTYLVLDQPSKHVKAGLRGRWKATVATGNGFAIAAGVYSGGAIISKMGAHAAFEYQSRPTVSIWGGPRQTDIGGGPLGYLIEPDLQYEYQSVDSNLPVHGTGVDVIEEVQVSGNTIRAWSDGGHWAHSYNDDMVSALLGDDGSGNGGYIYFQSGPNADANNPYIYEIWFASLDTPQEMLPDPKLVPDASKVPIVAEGDFPFATDTELFRYTPVDGGPANMFEIDVAVVSAGITLGYAGVVQKWRCGGGKFSGNMNASTPTQVGSDHLMSENSSVVSLSGTLGQTVSGADIIITYSPTRTGTDATAYQPHVKALLIQKGPLIGVTS